MRKISNIRAFFGIEREYERYYQRLKKKLNIDKNLRDDKDLIQYEFIRIQSDEKYKELKSILLNYHPLESIETKHNDFTVNPNANTNQFRLEKP